ncbi:MAG: hypothetical protein LH660_18290 [Phormidesmis sp. CAN_BIN36]|nr:hypothetical protein [Phormidesmis sp. CAN_BIN36]
MPQTSNIRSLALRFFKVLIDEVGLLVRLIEQACQKFRGYLRRLVDDVSSPED